MKFKLVELTIMLMYKFKTPAVASALSAKTAAVVILFSGGGI
jgi:hypothetical protein